MIPTKRGPDLRTPIPTLTCCIDCCQRTFAGAKDTTVLTLSIPVFDPYGLIHFPKFLISRIHNLDDSVCGAALTKGSTEYAYAVERKGHGNGSARVRPRPRRSALSRSTSTSRRVQWR